MGVNALKEAVIVCLDGTVTNVQTEAVNLVVNFMANAKMEIASVFRDGK